VAGDGSYRVLNRNDGITEADYYDRGVYQETFREVFDQLRLGGVFTRSIPEIENSDLFKLSPFKALSQDQAVAVEDILEGLFHDLGSARRSTSRFSCSMRHYPLLSQMRVKAGSDYVTYVRRVLGAASASGAPQPVTREAFEGYDLRLFDSVAEMRKSSLA